MTVPMIPVSWGELLDKIAILQIKVDRLRDPSAVSNARNELAMLEKAAEPCKHVAELRDALRAVNTRLWRIEDKIREHERNADFGKDFVALARAVYHLNDERGRIKRALNLALGSALVEEKQYSAY